MVERRCGAQAIAREHKRVRHVNLLQHIAQSRSLLRKSELKVADHVLLDPASVMHSSMADLAHAVGVSEPTIVRFCRRHRLPSGLDLTSCSTWRICSLAAGWPAPFPQSPSVRATSADGAEHLKI
ncbi:hypothetical protein SSTU70S_05298 [Stutzerimonas stutzeri]